MLRIIIACFTVLITITSTAGTGKLQAILKESSNHKSRGTLLHSSSHLDGDSNTAIRRVLGKREEHRLRKNRIRGSIVVKDASINTDAQSKKAKHEQRLMNKKETKNERNKQKMGKLIVSKKTPSQRGAKSAKGSKAGDNDSTPSKTARPTIRSNGGKSNKNPNNTPSKTARPTTSSNNGKSNKTPNPKSGKSQHSGKSGKHVRVRINTNILEMIMSHVKSLTNTIDSFH